MYSPPPLWDAIRATKEGQNVMVVVCCHESRETACRLWEFGILGEGPGLVIAIL